jgi:hypothetical protein
MSVRDSCQGAETPSSTPAESGAAAPWITPKLTVHLLAQATRGANGISKVAAAAEAFNPPVASGPVS